MSSYLRYSPDIETPETDEAESIDGIIQGMTQQSEVVQKREQHAVPASHARAARRCPPFRYRENGIAEENPTSIDQTPLDPVDRSRT